MIWLKKKTTTKYNLKSGAFPDDQGIILYVCNSKDGYAHAFNDLECSELAWNKLC